MMEPSMEWMTTDHYDVARQVLQRGTGFVYVLAFLNVRNQFPALLGETGLLPVPDYLARRSFSQAPSLFHYRFSDGLIGSVAWVGMTLALTIVAGGLDVVPVWVGMVVWLLLWAMYLSIVNVGQTFYSFGWESLLLEAGFYAPFLGNDSVATPWLVLVAFRWLLFRVEFGAGLIKLRGDRCWRDLTCMEYHHETQPMPGPTSRWFHLLGKPLHRIEVVANFTAQLLAPFLLFLPQPMAGVGAVVLISTQGYLMLSGNYAWLNLLTLLLGFSAIPDGWYGASGGIVDGGGPTWFIVLTAVFALAVLALSYQPTRNLFSSRQRMNASFNKYHLVNTYGAFGSVTRHRREVVIEGTRDGETWLPYGFKAKPGDPARVPRQFAPYHLRLDWLMWFVAISPGYGKQWFDRLLAKLLDADPATLRLLANDPFDGAAPQAIRARLVDYRFATRAERREKRVIWIAGRSKLLARPISRAGVP